MTPHPGRFWSSPPPPASGAARKVLFLDRDGVVNINHGYVHRPDQTDWVAGVFDAARAAKRAGYGLVIVTNQAGIARGYYSEDQFLQFTRWIHEQFAIHGADLLATYYCPHHPEGIVPGLNVSCECRKPGPGMILAAGKDLEIDLGQSLLVGDQTSDLQAAASAGIERSWLIDDRSPEPFREFVEGL
ncbi:MULTISPECIES: D-glycero-beta-D-manno-heptose 1,7-bisphosphate 7-phosphatase [Dyella]|uniref:D,D-heptose 1,7-bisphosphate phosphatase n=2 Tax=Dyella TaxID=231454 RepID=A0A4R0YYF2_9GAMM|nr:MULTISPECIES: D-glycero-beta-D-manno-heptose 1,7-bisphosphate 7-phosphatase [Dyella]TBR40360.1 D-glycero-beta-D-manno-heptose 1,7-bisphosphate 7-phosphatase [Dyella terrae]TCI12058.1 D-glycero-beta-D-manno-heptose 1,7-bisphosphate 7-phosphatase [Dyella soli]